MTTSRISVLALAIAALGLAALAGPAQAAEDVLGIEVSPGQAPETNASDQVTLEGYQAGQQYNWTVRVADEYDVVDLVIHDGFNVSRGRQWVPLVDGNHFVELTQRAVRDVDRPAKVFNLTAREDGWAYRLGLPGPGERNLTLHRDVRAPEVALGPVRNVTDVSFDVKTWTSEPAMAELVLEGPGIERGPQATPKPGVWQRFPVQGLDAETTYRFHVRVWDWSGNDVRTATDTVTTRAEPVVPEPVVDPIRPLPNATVRGERGLVVEASFSSNGSAVDPSAIRLFFDKEPIARENFTVSDGRISYRVDGPLEPRPYFVGIEVPNEAGGTGIARWSFTVEGSGQADSPLGLGVLAGALACGLALVGRRRVA